jgi:hypothetical protein
VMCLLTIVSWSPQSAVILSYIKRGWSYPSGKQLQNAFAKFPMPKTNLEMNWFRIRKSWPSRVGNPARLEFTGSGRPDTGNTA